MGTPTPTLGGELQTTILLTLPTTEQDQSDWSPARGYIGSWVEEQDVAISGVRPPVNLRAF